MMMGDESGNGEAAVTSMANGAHVITTDAQTPAAALVTPTKQKSSSSDAPSPPSAKVVHYTDVRTKALGVKAELEELRSKQLAKNIRSEIVDNGESVPLSSSEITDFFLRKSQMDKAWRQEQRESIEYLHTYKNSTTNGGTSSSQTTVKFSSHSVCSEMGPFYDKQRALNQEWKRQQQVSMAFLHNYRDNGTGLNGTSGDENDLTKAMVTPGDEHGSNPDNVEYDISAAIRFHEMQKALDERMELAVNTPLPPDSPIQSASLEMVEEDMDGSDEPLPELQLASSSGERRREDAVDEISSTPPQEEPQRSPMTESAQVEEAIENNEDNGVSVEEVPSGHESAQVVTPDESAPDETSQIHVAGDCNDDAIVDQDEHPPAALIVAEDNDAVARDEDDADDTTNNRIEPRAPVIIEQAVLESIPATNKVESNAVGDDVATDADTNVDTTIAHNEMHVEISTFVYETEMTCQTDDNFEVNRTSRTWSGEMKDFNKLVEYMSPDISSDTAPDNLEELLKVENDEEVLVSLTAEVTGEDSSDEVDAGAEVLTSATAQAPCETTSPKQSPKAIPRHQTPRTPPSRRHACAPSKRSESKIVRPRPRITKQDGLPHYMTRTISTPERRTKIESSVSSPHKPPSLLYSRRETAGSFKKKSNECTNKWIPSLHPSRDGCERCLHFASEEERLKFQRDGHHYRIWSVRGGCSRACPCFPRTPDQAPIRLCRKCFYDTHRHGKM